MKVYEMTAVGVEHEHEHKPCEDHVTTSQWNGVVAEACADGAGDCRLGGEEARRLSATLAQFAAMYFHRLWDMPRAEAAQELLRVIRGVQEQLMQETGASAEDMGCTVVVAAMDRRSHRCLGVSLGDGILLGRKFWTGRVYAMLPPEKREGGEGSYLTRGSDEEILEHLRIVQDSARDALMVSSNGLERTLWDVTGRRLSPTVEKLMNWVADDPEAVRVDFAEAVYDLSLRDDAGVAVMVDHRDALGAWEGKDPTLLCRRRRCARRYRDYLHYRDAGFGRQEAGRRVGWRMRDVVRNISYMKSIGLD